MMKLNSGRNYIDQFIKTKMYHSNTSKEAIKKLQPNVQKQNKNYPHVLKKKVHKTSKQTITSNKAREMAQWFDPVLLL